MNQLPLTLMNQIWIGLGWFLLGCSISTFLAFLASLHPGFHLWVIFLWLVFLLLLIIGCLADDALAARFNVSLEQWWSGLILSLLSALIGLGIWLWI